MGTTVDLSMAMVKALIDGVYSIGYSAVFVLDENKYKSLEVDKSQILILDWAPQMAVLSHPAVKLAVLHCGFGGVQEAVYNGVPIICLPQAFDHVDAAVRVAYHGVGISLDPRTLTSEQVVAGIKTIERGNYTSAVRKLSKIFIHAGGVNHAASLIEFFYLDANNLHEIPINAHYLLWKLILVSVALPCLLHVVLRRAL